MVVSAIGKKVSKTNMLSATLSDGSFNNVTIRPNEKLIQSLSAKNMDKKHVQFTANILKLNHTKNK
jgi:hypothetical protein